MEEAIRNQYASLGVEAYYQKHGSFYRNPHEEQIRSLLHRNANLINDGEILDFCCGSGEVTIVLAEVKKNSRISASDPFTFAAYQERTGKKAHTFDFKHIVRNGLPQDYDSVICSFAMHLCPDDMLFDLSQKILLQSRQLIIITPHKRPQLEKFEGINLTHKDEVPTSKGKMVRLKIYQLAY